MARKECGQVYMVNDGVCGFCGAAVVEYMPARNSLFAEIRCYPGFMNARTNSGKVYLHILATLANRRVDPGTIRKYKGRHLIRSVAYWESSIPSTSISSLIYRDIFLSLKQSGWALEGREIELFDQKLRVGFQALFTCLKPKLKKRRTSPKRKLRGGLNQGKRRRAGAGRKSQGERPLSGWSPPR